MKYYFYPYILALIFLALLISESIQLHQARATTQACIALTGRAIVIAQQWKNLSNIFEKIATECVNKERLDTVPNREKLLNL